MGAKEENDVIGIEAATFVFIKVRKSCEPGQGAVNVDFIRRGH